MTTDIDDLIREGSTGLSPDGLGALEAAVWQRVNRHHARATAGRLQAGARGIAPLVGAGGGGVMARDEPHTDAELHVLTVEAGLSPFGLTGDVG